jgi:hypothetical protein
MLFSLLWRNRSLSDQFSILFVGCRLRSPIGYRDKETKGEKVFRLKGDPRFARGYSKHRTDLGKPVVARVSFGIAC